VRAGNSLAAIARAYGVTVTAIAEANGIQDVNTIHVGQELVIPDPARIPAGPVVQPRPPVGDGGQTAATPLPALEQREDTDPGPPFTIEVSLNRAIQDPLVVKSKTYKVTGIVRNDGDRTYAVSTIHVTFFDASGFRGTFKKFPQPWESGGEWHWHGETEAEFAALFLAPGEGWPFSVEITAQDMASFTIHSDAVPTDREPAAVELSAMQVVDTGSNFVRIRGTASNTNPFVVKNVIVSGVLIDAGGQIVSIGSTFGLEEDIMPGTSVRFDLRVAREPYTSYRLYAQAERDWD
jgi:LysM repeat protein